MIRYIKNILIILLLMAAFLQAGDFNKAEIQKAATRFISESAFFNNEVNYKIERIQRIYGQNSKETIARVVHLSPRGFIILSADSLLKPVLAWSADSRFSGHLTTLDLIRGDVQARKKSLQKNKNQRLKNRQYWQVLLGRAAGRFNLEKEIFGKSGTRQDDMPVLEKTGTDSIYYFPTPVWGQGYTNGYLTFNYYTPNHWSTGCVATAMAEVLAYYHWPPKGTGSHCYTEDDAGQLCANFAETEYDWANILEQYQGVYTVSAQRRAAGLLSYHTAISVNMDFESNGSTAETANAPDAFHNYFRLSGHYSSVGSSGFWEAMQNNMKDARPVILSIKRSDGFGHAVVVDGFAESTGGYHLNMGWDGDDNGFYDISGSWNAGGYTIVVGAAKGLVPNPMLLEQVEQTGEKSFILSWKVSKRQNAAYYELEQATKSTGPWTTLSASVADTFYHVHVSEVRNYYYRVRTRRDDIWWDWSEVQKISMGGPRQITFNVDMRFQSLQAGDSVVVRGNIAPLKGSQNSIAFSDSDGIYSQTFAFDLDHAGEELSYRFAIAGSGGTTMESFNRTHTIGWDEFQNLDTVYFDNFTAIGKAEEQPGQFELEQNYPNPFNSETVLSYQLPVDSWVELNVYNLLGQNIKTLVNEYLQVGKHTLKFNAAQLPTGIYLVKLKAGNKYFAVKKIVYVK